MNFSFSFFRRDNQAFLLTLFSLFELLHLKALSFVKKQVAVHSLQSTVKDDEIFNCRTLRNMTIMEACTILWFEPCSCNTGSWAVYKKMEECNWSNRLCLFIGTQIASTCFWTVQKRMINLITTSQCKTNFYIVNNNH